MAFLPGMLVQIQGLNEKVLPLAGREAQGTAPMDLNGMRAQLVQYDRAVRKWIAATFNGQMLAIEQQFLRALGPEELKGYDFVMGPKSDYNLSGQAITESLATKGYAVVKLLVADEDEAQMLAAARRLDEQGEFSRLAVEFERGYLGLDSSAKTVHLGLNSPDPPDFVRQSPFKTMDDNFGQLCSMLGSYTEESLGFEIYSRTDLLLRMQLADGEEEDYPPADVDDGDAEGFMHLMYRKRLAAMQFVGPAEGSLKLVSTQGGPDVELAAEPHTMLLILSSRWDFCYEPEGQSLVLQTFFLAAPAVYTMLEVHGVDEVLSLATGPTGEQISIDGMYCRYGMASEGRAQFWSGAGKASCDGLTAVPQNRWDNSLYFDSDQTAGGTYCNHGCFGIEGVDLFDCRFFEVSPMEAKLMDPVQRQVLEVSYSALLEAGYDKNALQRKATNIGHFVGIDKDDWMVMAAAGDINLGGACGAAAAANSITANRFSYLMNLKGASMTIDTACSSSLVCSHVSKLHLRAKDFDPMTASIVNGINLMLHPGPFIACSAAGMLSHAGRCFTFNSTADGYARGELCGALCFALKQFEPQTGSICCLAGSQANQDGRSASLTAPNGPAQEKCIKAVLREAGLTPSEVDIFECHGTGTALGDPIEVGSFKKVMSATPRAEPLSITSSKSNIAHAEGGAGLAGFFKCCLQVSQCEASPNVHLKVKNPHIDMEGFPCHMLSESLCTRQDDAYAGVSSFGFGGTNAHAEAWGRNIMNSRGNTHTDPVKHFEQKLRSAPPPQITMNGDDVRDWETTGLAPEVQFGERYKVHLDEDGATTCEKIDEELEDFGDEFSLRGSFSDWDLEPLDRHESIPGLWTTTFLIGDSGEEEFQIVADEDEEKVYYPKNPHCTSKVQPVQGPGVAPDTDHAWLVRGRPGDTFRIEFFQQGPRRSVLWLRESQ
ncbi:unnamed protein product [Polarella glacialis]|uniref:Ketosynthase family 3 (KS3) domain-containing protein n=1 Tax=Polarella glacialis TaxID=89957 RepID=A0A813J067_POLGL|nr:unnamed protein product [Polarella glacialis]CAE8663289.1 unnamed protein product [Polarella glacialis]